MIITEAYLNREKIINACKNASACKTEFHKLISADNQIDFENILLANFNWCVNNNILEEWLPNSLPNCIELYCRNCTWLTGLPELPNCVKLDCSDCTGLTGLPELPNCVKLDCSNCTGLN